MDDLEKIKERFRALNLALEGEIYDHAARCPRHPALDVDAKPGLPTVPVDHQVEAVVEVYKWLSLDQTIAFCARVGLERKA